MCGRDVRTGERRREGGEGVPAGLEGGLKGAGGTGLSAGSGKNI